jgi:pyruvate dehydrogenase E1 component alpha subunit
MGPAVGAAMAAKLRGRRDVAVSYIGEGAANQGAFHEALNLAAIWKAPVIFVIEDNAYGISVPKSDCTAVRHNSDRAVAYGIPGFRVPNNDPDEIWSVAGAAIERAREGKGPTLIEIDTVRLEGHFMGDAEGYRPDEEKQGLAARDPIPLYRKRLEDEGVASNILDTLEAEVKSEVAKAVDFARQSPEPSVEDAFQHVFA